MAEDNLNELKRELYEAFRVAVKHGKEDFAYSNNPSHQAAATAMQAAAEMAKAIALIEREQREAKGHSFNKLDKN